MRFVDVTMGWSIIDILLLVAALISQIAMVRYVCLKEGDRRILPLFFLYNIYRIFEYAELTREERGRVGFWFWIFALSLFMLFTSLTVEMLQPPIILSPPHSSRHLDNESYIFRKN